MATLNTLRTKGGVIVSIVIGIALLAFLLGDLSSANGMLNSRKMRVGEINGTHIGYLEYTNLVDNLTAVQQAMSGKDALSNEEQEQVKEMAWDELINQYALSPGFEDLGMAVSEAEQIDMVDGAYLSPVINSVFTNPNTGMFDPAILRNFVANISQDASGRSAMIWNYLKAQMTRQRLMSKYVDLVGKGIFVTDLEIQQAVANANTNSSISYIQRDYDLIADSLVNVSESEVRDYYNKHQRLFRQTASRDIEYVVFDVLPSEQDYADAAKYVDQMASEFEASETPLQYAMLNSQAQPSQVYLGENQLPGNLAGFAFGPNSDKLYGPVLESDTYTIARVADSKMMPDSIGARHILIAADNAALADSLEKVLRSGADFAALAQEYSIDPQAAQQGGDLGVFPPERMIPEFSQAALAVDKGQFFRVTTPYGIHLGQLTYKSKPVKKVQLATISYKIEPSEITQQAIYGNVSKFISEASGSYENFKKATTDNALAKRVARIHNTDRDLNGMTNSREVVRWAFNAKKGEVSPIMEVDGNYVIAALDAASEDGYTPIAQISQQIAEVLRHEKKGRMLADSLSGGTSLAEMASRTGAEIKQASGIEFNGFYIEGVGVEPTLIGAVTAVEPGKLSKPVIGGQGVFLFDVTSRENVPTTTPESEKVRLQASAAAYMGERVSQALLDDSKIVDKRVKFF